MRKTINEGEDMTELATPFSRRGTYEARKTSEKTKKFIEDNLKTQEDWQVYLDRLIRNNANAAIRALMVIYNNQTTEEKHTNKILESNKKGFNAIDVVPLSKIAKRYKDDRYSLTVSDIRFLQKRLPKYWKQIMIVSKANLEDKKELPIVKEKTRVENELMLRKQEKLMRQQYLLEERNAIEDGSLHLEQMQLDLFPEGEYHNNIITKFEKVDSDGKL